MPTSKAWVKENTERFRTLLGKTVCVKIDRRTILEDAPFHAVTSTRLTDLDNPPKKRIEDDANPYTPQCFTLMIGDASFTFVIEDVTMTYTISGGINIATKSNNVTIEEFDAHYR